jgi:predicted transcriptional regulator
VLSYGLIEEDLSGVAVTTPDDKVVVVISEIDIIKFIDQDWDKLTAEDVMSTFVRTIDPETTINKPQIL